MSGRSRSSSRGSKGEEESESSSGSPPQQQDFGPNSLLAQLFALNNDRSEYNVPHPMSARLPPHLDPNNNNASSSNKVEYLDKKSMLEAEKAKTAKPIEYLDAESFRLRETSEQLANSPGYVKDLRALAPSSKKNNPGEYQNLEDVNNNNAQNVDVGYQNMGQLSPAPVSNNNVSNNNSASPSNKGEKPPDSRGYLRDLRTMVPRNTPKGPRSTPKGNHARVPLPSTTLAQHLKSSGPPAPFASNNNNAPATSNSKRSNPGEYQNLEEFQPVSNNNNESVDIGYMNIGLLPPPSHMPASTHISNNNNAPAAIPAAPAAPQQVVTRPRSNAIYGPDSQRYPEDRRPKGT